MKIAVFIDTQNVYFSLKHNRKSKLDYPKLMEYFKDLGEVTVAYAYGYQSNNESVPFITMLRAVGVTPRFSKQSTNKSVELACDVMKTLYSQEVGLIVIVSSDGSLAPLIRHANHHDTKIMTMGAEQSKEFEAAYDSLEFPPSVLRSYDV